jgi:hypothetical protein
MLTQCLKEHLIELWQTPIHVSGLLKKHESENMIIAQNFQKGAPWI